MPFPKHTPVNVNQYLGVEELIALPVMLLKSSEMRGICGISSPVVMLTRLVSTSGRELSVFIFNTTHGICGAVHGNQHWEGEVEARKRRSILAFSFRFNFFVSCLQYHQNLQDWVGNLLLRVGAGWLS